MKRCIAYGLTATTAVITALALVGTHTTTWHDGMDACPTEDSVSCYWDADTMGNGHGRSYTVDAHGVVTYIR